MMKRIVQKIKRKLIHDRYVANASVSDVAGPRLSDAGRPFHWILEGESFPPIREKLQAIGEQLVADIDPFGSVLIKINLNSSCPYPASTSGEMLLGLVELLKEHGIHNIAVGDCSSTPFLPTRKVFSTLQLDTLLKHKAKMVCFESEDWVRLVTGTRYLQEVIVSSCVYRYDTLINLCNVKTHQSADFSLGMKNLVGFLHPQERPKLHEAKIREKIAELGMVIQPDITIIDGRKVFISGGPNRGVTAAGDRVFISNDRISIEAAAYSYLYRLKEKNSCTDHFTEDPFEMVHFRSLPAAKERIVPERDWRLL